jgi:hypothetical protein
MPRLWRNWPVWTVSVLVGLHLIAAWIETFRLFFGGSLRGEFAVLVGCNILALWLLLRTSSMTQEQSHSA